MKNKIKKTILVLVVSLINLTVCSAACDNDEIGLNNGGSVSYSYAGTGYTTHLYYTDDRTSTVYNAFCLEPSKQTSGGCLKPKEVTNNDDYEDLVRALYYSYNAPGWSSGWENDYNNSFCDGGNGGTCSNNEYYAYSHVILAYYYHDIKSDNGWDTGLNSDIRDNAMRLANEFIAKSEYPPSEFKVYLLENSATQDIIYWTYEESSACADVIKRSELDTSKKLSGAKFQLYEATKASECTDSNKVGSEKTTNSKGKVTWKDLDPDKTYFVKETSEPSGYENNNSTCTKINTSKTSCSNNYRDDYPNYYCARVKKVDAEDNSLLLNGAKFTFTFTNPSTELTHSYSGTTPGKHSISRDGASSGTQASNGYYLVDMLPYAARNEKVTFEETNSNGDVLTDQNGNKYKYWNSAGTVSKTGLKKMTRSGTTYTCPETDDATVVAKNYKQYACLKVKKVDKVTRTALSGAKFKLYTNSAQTTQIGNEVSTDSNGIATWFLGSVDSNIDISTYNYNVKETKAPSGYSIPNPDNKNVKGFLLSKNKTYSQAQTECLGTTWDSKADSFVFEDAKLLLNWFKSYETTT
ncbi:MAG: hypothetical protein J6D12_06200, partial [Peptostreptococcaceae bacterium]|nr:hypothetical protein [Peptostreptococcaceae bacterium]